MDKPADGEQPISDRQSSAAIGMSTSSDIGVTGSLRESIDMAVFLAVPEYLRVTMRVEGLTSAGEAPARALLRRAWRGGEPDPHDPSLSGWREAYHAVGLGDDVVPPHEALMRWAIAPGGVPSQGAMNDLVNAFSLQHRVPVAAYDLGAVTGHLWLAPARGLETFLPAGSEQAQVPTPGEMILADSAGNVAARYWHGAQGAQFMVTPSTKHALVHVDLLAPQREHAEAWSASLTKLITGFLGGVIRTCDLTWGTPRTTWIENT